MSSSELRVPIPGLDSSSKLRAQIEQRTQAHVLAEAARINKAAESSASAPTAEVLSEVFETPEEVWQASRVRTVAQSLYKDYLRLLLPYIDAEKRVISKDAPSDEELRKILAASSKTYATFSKSNQHATWFKFYTDRTKTNADRETIAEMLELRGAVETGQLTEAEAQARLSSSRAGVLAKARALQNMQQLKEAGVEPTRKQIKDTQAAYKAIQAEDRERARATDKKSTGKSVKGRVMSPATRIALRAKAQALADQVEKSNQKPKH
jgi:hypothetical protein